MNEWRIGCSGFQYKEWKDLFYPDKLPQTKFFEYYTTRFNCLELNSTFYHFPKVSTLEKWYNRSPENFKFSVKVPQTITHYRKFKDCEDSIKRFYDSLQLGLKEKLGPVLFQLPPSTIYSQEIFDRILSHMDPHFENVIEFRHRSWWNKEVQERLSEENITFSGVSHPKMPDDIIVNHSLLYYRLHGVPVMFKSLYDEEFISKLFHNLQAQTAAQKIYVLFNNTWGTAGVVNALQFQEMHLTASR